MRVLMIAPEPWFTNHFVLLEPRQSAGNSALS